MSLLSKIFSKRKIKINNANLTLIGPTKSGKTTFVRYLETGTPVETDVSTTLGVEIRKDVVKVDSWNFAAIDTGGQELYQQAFWEMAITQAHAVIFIIDATVKPETDPEMYELSRNQFSYALEIVPEHVPLLVLLNKQDLKEKDPLEPSEAIQILNLGTITERSIAYLPCSAKFGDGVEVAMDWLVQKLEELEEF